MCTVKVQNFVLHEVVRVTLYHHQSFLLKLIKYWYRLVSERNVRERERERERGGGATDCA